MRTTEGVGCLEGAKGSRFSPDTAVYAALGSKRDFTGELGSRLSKRIRSRVSDGEPLGCPESCSVNLREADIGVNRMREGISSITPPSRERRELPPALHGYLPAPSPCHNPSQVSRNFPVPPSHIGSGRMALSESRDPLRRIEGPIHPGTDRPRRPGHWELSAGLRHPHFQIQDPFRNAGSLPPECGYAWLIR